jgi:hypothetical protein
MNTNLGIADRIIRILIAVTVVSLFSLKIITGTLATVLLVVSGVLVITALVGWCPIYRILGIRSKSKEIG